MPEILPITLTQPLFPPTLDYLKLSAPYTGNRGEVSTIELIKYPHIKDYESEEEKKVEAEWRRWWHTTSWAIDPVNTCPKWGSTSRSSPHWKEFGEAVQLDSGKPFVFCFNCGSILQHPSHKQCGNSHLRNHRRSNTCRSTQIPVHMEHHQSHNQPFQPHMRKSSIQVPSYSPDTFDHEVVRVVIDNNWSFRTVERPSFRRFIQFLTPKYTTTIGRQRFLSIFEDQVNTARTSILSDLGESTKLSIALDAWSAKNHLTFLAIKAYYINKDWKLCEKLLNFVPIRGSHTGTSMAQQVLQVLSDTNTKRQLLAVTCDNASNNGTLTRTIEEKLQQESISWDNTENTIPCLAHIINLVVQDIIQHLRLGAPDEAEAEEPLQPHHLNKIETGMSVPNSLRKLRTICKAIDQSPQRFERFVNTQKSLPPRERLSVIRDVRTRWNSTYDMCERAVALKPYIDEWLQQEINRKSPNGRSNTGDPLTLKRLPLSVTEWHHLELITEMLKNFKDATDSLSQSRKPQIQFIWLMYNRLFDFLDQMTENLGEDSENRESTEWPSVVKDAANQGRAKLSKYYAKTDAKRGYLFNCASILDPTQKLTIYEDPTWESQDKHNYRQQFLEYLDRYDSQEHRVTLTSITPPKRPPSTDWFRKPTLSRSSSSNLSSIHSEDLSHLEKEVDEGNGPTRREGESYLSTPIISTRDRDFDVLAWWKSNEVIYPRLAQVAKDILPVQIATVGVERVFNIARDVIGDRRCKLSAQRVQQIMILKDIISQEQEQEQDCNTVDDLPSTSNIAEIEDLFELQAQPDEPEGPDKHYIDITSADEGPVPKRRTRAHRK